MGGNELYGGSVKRLADCMEDCVQQKHPNAPAFRMHGFTNPVCEGLPSVAPQGAVYVTNNGAYTWTAAVQETVDATLNRTVSSGAY